MSLTRTLVFCAFVEAIGGVCDLAQGAISVQGSRLTCNGSGETDLLPPLVVTGVGSGSISIGSAILPVILRDVASSASVTISGSSATLFLDGGNEFRGVFCATGSNVTLLAVGFGRLDTDGGSNPGLGVRAGDSCGDLVIMNGSVVSRGGDGSSGIGTGRSSSSGVSSTLSKLAILDGNETGTSDVRRASQAETIVGRELGLDMLTIPRIRISRT
jgi:hypothetical protein